ncbi:MAG: TatD family hydrolase [Methanomicrobiales archaeon]|nr:TatD family hydrolase [Methanomicrobiales archaeon]MDD1660551.1 TatD family hydrolase [Methanomicrobiales archaeon]
MNRVPRYPITDDHIHLDPVNGIGIAAAKEFQRAAGTHLFLVAKPSWSHGIVPSRGEDYRPVFEATLSMAREVRGLGLGVFAILGVHPAEISRLSEQMPLDRAAGVMQEGLTLAAGYVRRGEAVALKSGRPHYPVEPPVWEASQSVLRHALALGADCGCAVQIHAESGPCADVVEMARDTGMDPGRVVKHFATPDTPLVPSLIARHEMIPSLCREGRTFTMESDYMDERSRPGAVIGPRSVPRFTLRLLGEGAITDEDIWRIHAETPSRVYGVEIHLP